jgi:hypothetical protein
LTSPLSEAFVAIEDLPDFPAIQQLARALWRHGTARGAAVLVGAGFSKFADLAAADTPKPPIWSEFARDMAEQLYPHDPSDAPRDSLRLAEEYRTYFGQAALDEFVRVRICDPAWQPGELHRTLLELEWSDVLTTNWDTLLERGSHDGRRRYERVLSEADLAHSRAPRIVKLHGSWGTTEHFILAEEDYRTYPTRFAAFVNFARQVFIENELCLLGFSGDDPNFLQWSGWVRDNLGGNARRIYLVGVLDLGPAKRKLLEARNVAPIDLAPLVERDTAGERHKIAMRHFLAFLTKERPRSSYDWAPTPVSGYEFLPKTVEDHQRQWTDASYAASLLDKAARIWRADRISYPGWLICPARRRAELRYGCNVARPSPQVIDALSPTRRGEVLYELAWRHCCAQWPVDSHLAGLLANLADDPNTPGNSKAQRLEICILLLRTARQAGNDTEFARWAQVLEAQVHPDSDLPGELAYQRALRARDRLDLATVQTETASVRGADPVWMLRRAALLAELGEFAEAGKLIIEARGELAQRQRNDPNSLWLQSRRAWAEWLARAVEQDSFRGGDKPRWPLEFRQAWCDPEDEIEKIHNEVAADLQKYRQRSAPIAPKFEPGHYTDQSSASHLRSVASVEPLESLNILMETAGLPLRLNIIGFVGALARDAAEISFEPTFQWYVWFLRVVSAPDDWPFGRYFSRLMIAQLSTEVSVKLSESVTAAIAYWRQQIARGDTAGRASAVSRLRVYVEALARLTVRLDPVAARANFDLAAGLAGDLSIRHFWLYEPLANLANYSIQTLTQIDRTALVPAVLDFSLSTDEGGHPFHWPNPVESVWETRPNRVADDVSWKQCIARLIAAARPGSSQRHEAVLRLAYLSGWGTLDAAEATAFGEALWGQRDTGGNGLPAGTTLLAFLFAELPAPAGIDKARLVSAHLFDCSIAQLLSSPAALGTVEVGRQSGQVRAAAVAGRRSVRPTGEQAVRLFDDLVSWRPPTSDPVDPISASLLRPLREGARRDLGEMLRNTIVPSLIEEDRTLERLQGLLAFTRDVRAGTAAAALPYFLGADDKGLSAIVRGIHESIAGRASDEVAGGTMALEIWIERGLDAHPAPPIELVERVVSSMESGREMGLMYIIRCVRKMGAAGILTLEQKTRVSRALESLWIDYDYERIDPDSRQAVSVSLVRAECLRLARALNDAGVSDPIIGTWLKLESDDPLPEVRFALAAAD